MSFGYYSCNYPLECRYVTKEAAAKLHPALGLGVSDSELFMIGSDTYGSMGSAGAAADFTSWTPIDGSSQWKDAKVANDGVLAVKKDNTLWAWGDGAGGQLGNSTTLCRSTPVQITGTNWLCVSLKGLGQVGGALKTDNSLWTWGCNLYGSLGSGTTVNRSSPVQVAGCWLKAEITSLMSWGIRLDGSLWTWGNGTYGEIGDGTTNNYSSPVQVYIINCNVVQAAYGTYSMYAIQADNTMWAWGRNDFGTLGDGSTTDRCRPVQIGTGIRWMCVVPGPSNQRTAMALDEFGNRYVWGKNTNLVFGNGSSIATDAYCVPTYVDSGWTSLSFEAHANGIKKDGTLWAWGLRTHSGIPSGTACVSTPVQIGTDKNWIRVHSAFAESLGFKETKGNY